VTIQPPATGTTDHERAILSPSQADNPRS
jgi:hypothetical protein